MKEKKMRRFLVAVAAAVLLAVGLGPSAFAQTQVNSAQGTAQTAAWTSGTGANTAISASVANMGTVEVSFFVSGSITGGVITFEGSDNAGTTWYPLYAVPATVAPPATPVNTYTLSGSNFLGQVDVSAYNQFRIRLSTVITGSGTANVQWTASALPSRPVQSVQENLAQVAGAPAVTGVGPSGAGIPRVTLSNDSVFALSPFNVSQFGGNPLVTGIGPSGSGIPRVSLSNDSVFSLSPFNLSQLGGSAQVNGGLAGSQSIGGTQANNAAITQNPDMAGAQANATAANPTPATNGNARYLSADLVGDLFVRPGSPNMISCTVTLSSLTTTQFGCGAAPAAGFSIYITDFQIITTTAGTSTTVGLTSGTGGACGTGTAAISPTYPNVAIGNVISNGLSTPIKVAAATGVCAVEAGTTTGTSQVFISGFVAP